MTSRGLIHIGTATTRIPLPAPRRFASLTSVTIRRFISLRMSKLSRKLSAKRLFGNSSHYSQAMSRIPTPTSARSTKQSAISRTPRFARVWLASLSGIEGTFGFSDEHSGERRAAFHSLRGSHRECRGDRPSSPFVAELHVSRPQRHG